MRYVFVRFQPILEFLGRIFCRSPIYIEVHKNTSSGGHTDIRGQTGRRTDMTKLTGVFAIYVNAPKKSTYVTHNSLHDTAANLRQTYVRYARSLKE